MKKSHPSILNYNFLKTVLESNDFQVIHEKLSEYLENAIINSSFKLAFPQVLIVDDLYNIIDCFIFAKPVANEKKKKFIEKWRTSMLGFTFKEEYKDLLFYKKVLDKAKNSNSDTHILLAALQENTLRDNEYILGNYDIWIKETYSETLNKNSIEENWPSEEIVFASGDNAKYIQNSGLDHLLKYMCVTVIRWPGSDLTGRQMYGICGFLLHPDSIVSIKGNSNLDNLKATYNESKNDFKSITETIQTTVYLTQVFTMIQASVQDPMKLTDFLIYYAKTHEQENKNLLKNLLQILFIQNPLITRKIIREIIKTNPKFAIKFLSEIGKFLNAAHNENVRKEVFVLLNENLPPYREVQTSFWFSRYIYVLKSIFNHLHCFYQINKQTEDFILKDLIPFCYFVFSIKAEKTDVVKSIEDIKMISLQILEESFEFCTNNVWKEVIVFFEELNISIKRNGIDLERILELEILALHHINIEDDLQIQKLINSLLKIFHLLDNKKTILTNTHKLIAFLSIEKRTRLISALENEFGVSSGNYSYEQVEEIHIFQTTLYNNLRSFPSSIEGPNLISVVSSKGGVGKTTVAVCLAANLARNNQKVCFVDLDFFGPTLSYIQSHHNESMFTVNEFIWSFMLKDLEKGAESNKDLKHWIDIQFRNKSFLKDKFKNANWDNCEFIERLIPVSNSFYILPSSHNDALQNIMYPLVSNEWGIKEIGKIIKNLVFYLYKIGFTYIVFDCPAEIKDLTTVATKGNINSKGKNVFVSTMAENALDPTLRRISENYFVQSDNYLVINKIREHDRYLIKDKQSLIDYYSFLVNKCPNREFVSQKQVQLLFNIKECDTLRWDESLEKIFNNWKDNMETNIKVLTNRSSLELTELTKAILENK